MPLIQTSKSFDKSFVALKDKKTQKRVIDCLSRFIDNERHPSLDFKSLSGRDGYFTIRVNLNYRILMKAGEDDKGVYYKLVAVGTHNEIHGR